MVCWSCLEPVGSVDGSGASDEGQLQRMVFAQNVACCNAKPTPPQHDCGTPANDNTSRHNYDMHMHVYEMCQPPMPAYLQSSTGLRGTLLAFQLPSSCHTMP